jgi:intracellular multiplication protein IcmC
MTIDRHSKKIVTLLIVLIASVSFAVAHAVTEDTSAVQTAGQFLGTVSGSLDDEIQDIKTFLYSLCYIIGLSFIVTAVMSLKKFGQRGAFMQDAKASVLGPAIRLFLGVALMAVGDFLDIIYQTIWGYNVADAANIDLGSDSLGLASAIKPVKNIIQIVGLVAFIRGWLTLVRATNEGAAQPGTVSKGSIHIIGGVFAMNIEGTIQMIQDSMLTT